MSNIPIVIGKVLTSLPATLKPNAIYYVLNNGMIDTHIVNSAGTAAYKQRVGAMVKSTTITISGTLTLESTCYLIEIDACAGGNSGCKYSSAAAAGGASGAHIINYRIPVNGGNTLTLTIGSGGASVTTNQVNGVTGNAGGATVIAVSGGPTITLPAGNMFSIHTPAAFAGLVTPASASPAVCSTSSLNTAGVCWVGAGSNNAVNTNGGSFLGNVGGVASSSGCGGGASYFGRGGNGGNNTSGEDGQGYGAGGGGTVIGAQSGKGGNGVVIVRQYYS